MMPRLLCSMLVFAVAACVSTSEPKPFEVKITPQGYEVEGRALSTPQQVAEIIASRGVRHVRLVLDKDASSVQVEKAVAALQEAGAALGVVDSAPQKR